MSVPFSVKASRLGKPAYVSAPPRVTASMCIKHGSYAAARAALTQAASSLAEACPSHTHAIEAGQGEQGERA